MARVDTLRRQSIVDATLGIGTMALHGTPHHGMPPTGTDERIAGATPEPSLASPAHILQCCLRIHTIDVKIGSVLR